MKDFETLVNVTEVQTPLIEMVESLTKRPGSVTFGPQDNAKLLRAFLKLQQHRPTAFTRKVATHLLCDDLVAATVIIFVTQFFLESVSNPLRICFGPSVDT